MSTLPSAPPEALLLDFGGVLFATRRRPGWQGELARELAERLEAAAPAAMDDARLAAQEIETDIRAGCKAVDSWRDSAPHTSEPRELTHDEFWLDFVASDWPTAARAFVRAEAAPLCRRMGQLSDERWPREGMPELLRVLASRRIRVGVVSNALMGGVHRTAIRRYGLDELVAVQVYSDEVGIRKPHPGMITMAATALAAAPRCCWYVGDKFDRDVACGRKAGVGRTILMRSNETGQSARRARDKPDATVNDPLELRELVLRSLADLGGLRDLGDLDGPTFAAGELGGLGHV